MIGDLDTIGPPVLARPAATGPTGALSLMQALAGAGLDLCLANPGTSEMHLVAALEAVPGVRPVLGLSEGVVTGAADGYFRMTGRPAAALLHLGPGLANGLANLHNARKARSGVLCIVGDHATTHRAFDAPLSSDLAGFAAPVSHWLRASDSAVGLAADGLDALQAASGPPGRIATLLVPADAAWGTAPAAPPIPVLTGHDMSDATLQQIGARLPAVAALLRRQRGRQGEVALLIDGPALHGAALEIAARIAAAHDLRLIAPVSVARIAAGRGRPMVERVPYRGALAAERLAGLGAVILCGAAAPVNFFAYPGQPGQPLPQGCRVLTLATPDEDAVLALNLLEDALGTTRAIPRLRPACTKVAPSTGPLTLAALGAVLRTGLPEGAILIDEAITSGFTLSPMLAQAAPHEALQLTGGAIGIGLPLSAGAALGAPGQPVVCLVGDGSALYNLQALWTQARMRLPVVTVILNNGGYATLHHEMTATGAPPGPIAAALFDLQAPGLDWPALARGFGVEALRAGTVEGFATAFRSALTAGAPVLIEAVLTPSAEG